MNIFGFPEMDMIKGIPNSYQPHLKLSVVNKKLSI